MTSVDAPAQLASLRAQLGMTGGTDARPPSPWRQALPGLLMTALPALETGLRLGQDTVRRRQARQGSVPARGGPARSGPARPAAPQAAGRAAATPAAPQGPMIRAVRQLDLATAALAGSALLEGWAGRGEHAAGPALSAGSLAAGLHGAADLRPVASGARGLARGLAASSVLRLGHPGIPAALPLAGVLGALAEQLRDRIGPSPRLGGLPAGRVLAAISGLGLAGNAATALERLRRGGARTGDAALSVLSAPLAILLAHAAVATGGRRGVTRGWLRLTSLAGFGLAALRAVRSRQAGGPVMVPQAAPPVAAGLSLAGLAALSLLDRARRAGLPRRPA